MPVLLTQRIRRALARPAHVVAERALRFSGHCPPRVLLLLGHTRSGSTLLLHLLMTDARVGVVGERNRPYSGEADLACLALESRRARRPARLSARALVAADAGP